MSAIVANSSSNEFLCYFEPKVHDYELYFLLTKIDFFVMLPICVIGILSNSIALACLMRPPRITSGISVYLRALLLFDIAVLVSTVLSRLPEHICANQMSRDQSVIYTLCLSHQRFLHNLAPRIELTIATAHAWTIAAISAHRYWKLTGSRHDSVQWARHILYVIYAIVLLIRIPIFMVELRFVKDPMWHIDRSIWTTQILSTYRLVYYSIIDPLVGNILPFSLMCICSVLTIEKICRYGNLFEISGKKLTEKIQTADLDETALMPTNRQKSSGVGRRATVCIVVIVSLYLVFHLLELYNLFRKWTLFINGICPNRFDYIRSQICMIIAMISASLNAFVYIAFTDRIKYKIRSIVQKLKARKMMTQNGTTQCDDDVIGTDMRLDDIDDDQSRSVDETEF